MLFRVIHSGQIRLRRNYKTAGCKEKLWNRKSAAGCVKLDWTVFSSIFKIQIFLLDGSLNQSFSAQLRLFSIFGSMEVFLLSSDNF